MEEMLGSPLQSMSWQLVNLQRGEAAINQTDDIKGISHEAKSVSG